VPLKERHPGRHRRRRGRGPLGGPAARHRDRGPPVPAVAHDGRRRPVHGELLRSMT